MPWNEAQRRTARAVAHGWKPTGSAKGFTRGFAEQVLEESGEKKKKKRRGTLGDLAAAKYESER